MNKDKIFFSKIYKKKSEIQMLKSAQKLLKALKKRRSIREYSDESVSDELINLLISTASSAPSGVNCQPWFFAVVKDKFIKKQIREECEKIERDGYEKKFAQEFKENLDKLELNFRKKFLEDAPTLIIIFKEKYRKSGEEIIKNYSVNESVGISIGFLIAAIYNAGLVTVPYSPANTSFLNDILGRPENESAMLILPIGYPKEDTQIHKLERKGLEEIMKYY